MTLNDTLRSCINIKKHEKFDDNNIASCSILLQK